MERPLRILIAMPQADMRSALGFYLRNMLDADEVAEAADTQTMLKQAKSTQPGIILLDWSFADQPIAATVQALRQFEFEPGVILINVEPESEQCALSTGADAMVLKNEPAKKLLIAIETIRSRRDNDG